ncbi:hypothetical protein FDZ71_07040, partial [bacterium]
MALPKDHRIVELDKKIEEVRKQYDLYLSGLRKTEPASMLADVEVSILRATRQMAGSSTVVQFQIRALAHRFRSLQAQIKRFLDRRDTYIKSKLEESFSADVEEIGQTIFVDRAVTENPALIHSKIRSLIRSAGNGPNVYPDEIANILIAKAQKV